MSECLTGVSVTRGDDRDDALTQLITAPLTLLPPALNSVRDHLLFEVTSKTQTDRPSNVQEWDNKIQLKSSCFRCQRKYVV